jgi:hypothetical protein
VRKYCHDGRIEALKVADLKNFAIGCCTLEQDISILQ